MFRKHGRTQIRCPMYLKHQHFGYFEVITRDVSATGVFLGVEEQPNSHILGQLQLGDTLEALVESIGSEGEKLQLMVARWDKNGLGLRFV
jgi:hypothetical protein